MAKGEQQLASVLKSNSSIVGVTRITEPTIPPHPSLPEAQIGFADTFIDQDGSYRRTFLGSFDEKNNYRLSLNTRLVEHYLAKDSLTLENGIKDPNTIRFGQTEIPRFMSYTGGYIRADSGGNQALVNFRAGAEPFEKLSYTQVMSGSVPPDLLQDRIVLIGYVAESVADFITSGAIISDNPSLIAGVEFQAHAASQILSAVYNNRPFLTSLPELAETLLILCGGLIGAGLALSQRKPTLHWLFAIALCASWIIICYALIVAGWWLPTVPTLLAFMLNAAVLYPLYQTKAQLQAQIEERKRLVNWTYNTIHNGPLQILASVLSTWPTDKPPSSGTRTKLEDLNRELRNLYEVMQQEMLLADKTLTISGQRTIDLQIPLDAILYETYQATIERQQSFFEKVIQITTFEPMSDGKLTSEERRELARFLEEALINVYKYAKTATRLSIDCRQEKDFNVIRVTDNGKEGDPTSRASYGTQQANRLAKQLKGHFQRIGIQPHGICCELRWPARKS